MQKGFLYIFFSHTDFFPKNTALLVIYADFVLDRSGKSAVCLHPLHLPFWLFRFCKFNDLQYLILGNAKESEVFFCEHFKTV